MYLSPRALGNPGTSLLTSPRPVAAGQKQKHITSASRRPTVNSASCGLLTARPPTAAHVLAGCRSAQTLSESFRVVDFAWEAGRPLSAGEVSSTRRLSTQEQAGESQQGPTPFARLRHHGNHSVEFHYKWLVDNYPPVAKYLIHNNKFSRPDFC